MFRAGYGTIRRATRLSRKIDALRGKETTRSGYRPRSAGYPDSRARNNNPDSDNDAGTPDSRRGSETFPGSSRHFSGSETTTLIPAMGYSRAMASVACNIKSTSPTVHRCHREGQVT